MRPEPTRDPTPAEAHPPEDPHPEQPSVEQASANTRTRRIRPVEARAASAVSVASGVAPVRRATSAVDPAPSATAARTSLQRAHASAEPIWNTATASSHAIASCIATPVAVQRLPIWRFWAASVATHGV